MTINYSYDPLGRLTAADYSTGNFYHYTYDPVGNRLTQSTLLSGQPNTINYQYDAANRMTSANGAAYTWDANGNLLSNGASTYAYDPANRLTSLNQGTNNYAYTYRCNGLSSDQWGITGCQSDRVSQSVNGVTTNYVLDQAAGLTQVLQDGTNTYTYGVDRIAQVSGANINYFLGDALGSTRQLTDTSGQIVLSQSYDPYGVTAQTVGSGSTSSGFTGEMSDQTGLIYLRARYYSSDTGRFLSRDSWDGNGNQPMSYNLWNYVQSNPVNFTDPSGQFRIPCITFGDRIDTAERNVNRTHAGQLITDPLNTYTAAGIGVQCAGTDLVRPWDNRDYSGFGIAQISNMQVETCYGQPVRDPSAPGIIRGYGLKMPGETVHDQNNPAWAVLYMRRRIQQVTDMCKNCTSTDIFIAASLAQNGPGFDPQNMTEIDNPHPRDLTKLYRIPLDERGVTINWKKYFDDRHNPGDTYDQLMLFSRIVLELENRNWYVPPDLNWTYIRRFWNRLP